MFRGLALREVVALTYPKLDLEDSSFSIVVCVVASSSCFSFPAVVWLCGAPLQLLSEAFLLACGSERKTQPAAQSLTLTEALLPSPNHQQIQSFEGAQPRAL